jgi:O-antigen biosynthesis protein WbqP
VLSLDSVIKRAVDFILALLGLIILSPLFLIIIVAIKLDSKGPVLFKQKRVGKRKRNLHSYKFYTGFYRVETA